MFPFTAYASASYLLVYATLSSASKAEVEGWVALNERALIDHGLFNVSHFS